ncbi:MAG TPA: type IV pilus biogenesis/stability protein PilW, partial [Noviherbaspirillum sp.]|uniref:type IV pilus biogenesis/stability protein PilW n=1 Tax=Noviherbaspirillum sp. TaxID=1926288 RepID=UPI002DDC9B5B
MIAKWQGAFVAALAATALLAGCASGPMELNEELKTSSDQSEDQKRARIRLQLAIGYYEQRQMNVALDEIKRALQADPNLADAYSVRGLIYMDMGENRLAEDNFLQSIKLAPSNPDLTNNYGWFLCQTGRERQAMSYFESALNNRTYQSPAKALNNAGVCSVKVKDLAAAERYFIRAFQFEPGNPLTNAHLAKLHYDKKDYERARFYIGRVMKADIMTA